MLLGVRGPLTPQSLAKTESQALGGGAQQSSGGTVSSAVSSPSWLWTPGAGLGSIEALSSATVLARWVYSLSSPSTGPDLWLAAWTPLGPSCSSVGDKAQCQRTDTRGS